jgi:hypothetical protein
MLDYLQSKQFLIDMLNLLLMIAFTAVSTFWFIVLT